MKRTDIRAWIAGYERAWRAAGTAGLTELFTETAIYRPSPYAEPIVGVAAIAEMWDAERESPDELFTLRSHTLAVDGDLAVVRVDVAYGRPVTREYRDLWVIRFAADGRCDSFEEWPFWPGQPLSVEAGG